VASAAQLDTPSAHFSSVSAAGPLSAWAAGTEYVEGSPHGVILRWDGWRWSPDEAPGLPEVSYWYSVDAASPRDVYAYGWGGPDGEVVVHFDGHRWEIVELPELPGGDIYGFSEVAAERGRTYLAGWNHISTYSRGDWESIELGSGVQINGMDSRTARDAWAVGGFALVGQESRPVALHWDGKDWSEVPLPEDWDLRLNEVYVESKNSVYVAAHAAGAGYYEPRLLHWDGHSWEDITGPVTGISPTALTGDGHGTVWFSGNPEGWEGPPVFWRYDTKDGSWTRVTGETVAEGETQSYEVSDLAPIGLTGGYWSVGSYELLVGGNSSEQHEIIHHSWR
jgi:hypothetical protein